MCIDSETVTTGTWVCLATRSAVRCLVPVSAVWIAGSGIRWTLAHRMVSAASSRMIAPSILASSESRWAVNGTPMRKPPENRACTRGGAPSTTGAQDALQPLAEVGAGGEARERLDQLVVELRAGHRPGPGWRGSRVASAWLT